MPRRKKNIQDKSIAPDMNIRDLDNVFNEIFNEIEQMNEEQIKKIDFEIENNISKYRKKTKDTVTWLMKE